MIHKKKRFKRKMYFANAYEIDAVEKILEKEAANGWMFIKHTGLFFLFEACEPKKVKFQIDYFDKATIFDTNPETKTLDYIEYCKESGWQHVFSSGKMQIFYSLDENPVPIQTDEKMKLKLATKATILANWALWIFLPFIWGLTTGKNMVSNLLNPRDHRSYSRNITDLMSFGLFIFWLGFTVFAIINIIRLGSFYFKNSRRLKKGLNIKYHSSKNVNRFNLSCIIFLLLLMMFSVATCVNSTFFIECFLMEFIGVLFVVCLVNKLLYSKWANRKSNIVLTILLPIVAINVITFLAVFCIFFNNNASVSSGNTTHIYPTDAVDVTLDDLDFKKPKNTLHEETRHDKSESFLGKREEYSDECITDGNYFGYSIEIFSSKFSSIIDKYNELVLKQTGYSFSELTATENTWFSDEVFYVRGVRMYVVIGEGKTFVITGDLSKAQATQLSSFYMKK